MIDKYNFSPYLCSRNHNKQKQQWLETYKIQLRKGAKNRLRRLMY